MVASLFPSLLLLLLVGLAGLFLFRNNVIVILMSVELILFAINLQFALFSAHLEDMVGQLFALFVLTVAAAESAVGLALLVIYYRIRGVIAVDLVSQLKG